MNILKTFLSGRKLCVALLVFFTALFFYKFFFFGHLYTGADILNHWYYPWAARPDLQEQPPEQKYIARLFKFAEKENVGLVLSRPGNPEISDPVFTANPAIELSVKTIKKGEWPFWNPRNFCGYNIWADVTFSPFYPLNFLYFIPSVTSLRASTLKIIFSTLLLGYFMFALLQDMGRSKLASLAGALTLMFCSSVVSFFEYLSFLDAYVWLPAIILIFRRFLRSAGFRELILGSLVASGIVLAKNPKPISYIFSFLIAYQAGCLLWLRPAGIRGKSVLFRILAFDFMALIVGSAVSAVAILPTVLAISGTSRVSDSSAFLNPQMFFSAEPFLRFFNSFMRFAKWDLIPMLSILFPRLYGGTALNKIWTPIPYVELSCYLGLLPFVFISWSLFRKKLAEEVFHLSLAIYLFLVFLMIPPFYDFFVFFVPNSGLVRLLPVWSFCVAILFAFSIDKYLTEYSPAMKPPSICNAWLPLSMMTFCLILCALLLLNPHAVYGFFLRTNYLGACSFSKELTQQGSQSVALPFTFKEFNRFHLHQFVILAGLWAACLFFFLRPNLVRRKLLFLSFLFLHLAYFTIGINPTTSPKFAYIATNATRFLKSAGDDYRIERYGTNNIFPSGIGPFYGLSDADGRTASIAPTRMIRLFIYLDKKSFNSVITGVVPFSEPSILTKKIIDGMAIRYILASQEIPEINTQPELVKRFKLVWKGEGCFVYENLDVLPKAFLSFGAQDSLKLPPSKSVFTSASSGAIVMRGQELALLEKICSPQFDVTRSLWVEGGPEFSNESQMSAIPIKAQYIRNNETKYLVKNDRYCYLYVADSFEKGWTATVNGDPQPVYRANYAFRAVYLKPGNNTIVFHYTPPGFNLGMKISIMSLLLILLLCCIKGARYINGCFRRKVRVSITRALDR